MHFSQFFQLVSAAGACARGTPDSLAPAMHNRLIGHELLGEGMLHYCGSHVIMIVQRALSASVAHNETYLLCVSAVRVCAHTMHHSLH